MCLIKNETRLYERVTEENPSLRFPTWIPKITTEDYQRIVKKLHEDQKSFPHIETGVDRNDDQIWKWYNFRKRFRGQLRRFRRMRKAWKIRRLYEFVDNR